LYLIGLFLSIANYLIFISINFIGLSYLLIYIGVVSILFLFILMLINITSYTDNSLSLGILIVIVLNISICNILPNKILSNNFIDLNNVFNKFSIYILNTKGSKQDNIIYTSHCI
jgi:NADH-ubiquinone oxidoreductase chain 6